MRSSPTTTGPARRTRGLKPAVRGSGGLRPDGNRCRSAVRPGGGRDQRCRAASIANATFDSYFLNVHADTPVGDVEGGHRGSALGRADAVRHLIPNQIRVLRQSDRPIAAASCKLTDAAGRTQAMDAQSPPRLQRYWRCAKEPRRSPNRRSGGCFPPGRGNGTLRSGCQRAARSGKRGDSARQGRLPRLESLAGSSAVFAIRGAKAR
jgi:hypothetical protein